MIKRALILDPADNVATLLEPVTAGDTVELLHGGGAVPALEAAAFGHKIAIRPVPAGAPVLKYGQRIGLALVDILPGAWVHLHNMASALDADFRRRIES